MDEQQNEATSVSPYLKNENESKVWVAALIVTCLLIVLFRALSKKIIPNTSLGYLVGRNGVFALLVWGIFYAVFTRKKPTASKISFFVILSCFILSGYVTNHQQKLQARNTIRSIRSEFSKLNQNITKTSKGLALIEEPDMTISSTKSEFGELEKFAKNNFNQTIRIRNEMVREMQAIKWETLLSPQRIEQDPDFTEAWKMLKQAHAIIGKGEKATMAQFDDIVKSAKTLDVSSEMRAGLEIGIMNSMEISKSEARQIYQYEYGVLSDLKKLFEFLSTNKTWIVSNNMITFKTAEDASTYNSFIADIQNKAKQEALLQKKASDRVNVSLNNASKSLE